ATLCYLWIIVPPFLDRFSRRIRHHCNSWSLFPALRFPECARVASLFIIPFTVSGDDLAVQWWDSVSTSWLVSSVTSGCCCCCTSSVESDPIVGGGGGSGGCRSCVSRVCTFVS